MTSNKIRFDIRKKKKFLTYYFTAQANPIDNSLPSDNRLKTTSKAFLKIELKKFFLERNLKDPRVTDLKYDIESIRL